MNIVKNLITFIFVFAIIFHFSAPAKSADFTLSCPAGTGTSGPNALDVNGPGTNIDSLTISNAPANTVITFSYTAQNGPPRTMTASLLTGSVVGPTPATVSLISNGDTGLQVFTTIAAGTSSYNISIVATANGRSAVEWTATCSAPALTVEIANIMDAAEPAGDGILTVTQSAVTASDTVVALVSDRKLI